MSTRATRLHLPSLSLALAAALLLPSRAIRASNTGEDATISKPVDITAAPAAQPDPLNDDEIDASFVGQSPFKTKEFNGAGAQNQEPYRSIQETNLDIALTRRIHLFGHVYFAVGAEYERYDFGTTNAPIPTSLQKLGGVVGLEYLEQGEVGAFFHVRPGFYASRLSHLDSGNFDVPMDFGTILPVGSLFGKKTYVLIGARTAILEHYPILPIGGVVILLADKLRIQATPPEPRLIYSYSEALDIFVGAELLGDAYKRDAAPHARPQDQRFNNAVISYGETRLNGGVTITPVKAVDINLVGGWSLGSDFDYYRGGGSKNFQTQGAPYAKLNVTAEF